MKNKQLVIICMTFLTIGYVETLLADPQQGIHLNAEEFMKGGTFCFLEIAEADEWITTIKMIVKPSNDKQGIKVSGIDALRHGVSTHQPTAYNPFFSPAYGSAAITPSNDNLNGPLQLQIALSSTNYGYSDSINGGTGIWTGWYALVLDTKNLKGFINGRTEFTEIIKNQITDPQQQLAISADITPINCSKF
jgi:hypothetical protein